jgi:hypothetical protein
MKFILVPVLVFLLCLNLKSQNIQLHYDLGKERKYLTSTVEMFKADPWGSTYYFIDLDYGSRGSQGVSLAYFEITRGLKFWKSPFEIHVEYNGGFGQYKATPYNSAYQINDAWLFGGQYTWHSPNYSRVFQLQGMYKYIRGKNNASFQITEVWTLNFFKNKLTLSGFADFWREDNEVGPQGNTVHRNFVFLSEPQFWYNVTKNFSVGSEEELSVNFAGHRGFMINPTIAGKWTF